LENRIIWTYLDQLHAKRSLPYFSGVCWCVKFNLYISVYSLTYISVIHQLRTQSCKSVRAQIYISVYSSTYIYQLIVWLIYQLYISWCPKLYISYISIYSLTHISVIHQLRAQSYISVRAQSHVLAWCLINHFIVWRIYQSYISFVPKVIYQLRVLYISSCPKLYIRV